MRIAAALIATFAGASLVFGAPGRMDVGKRAARVSTEKRAVLPDASTPERNEVLLEKRVTPELLVQEEALVGERRSSLVLEETREKVRFQAPSAPSYDTIEHKESRWAGKKSRFSTAEDGFRSKVAIRFQDKIGEASPVSSQAKPVVDQATTFDRVNRFVFRKNADQTVRVQSAGSDSAGADASETYSPGAATPAGSR